MPSSDRTNSIVKFAIFMMVLALGGAAAILPGCDRGGREPGKGSAAPTTAILGADSFGLALTPRPDGWTVDGLASLEDGVRVTLEVVFPDPGEKPFASKQASVKDERISVEFGPYEAPMPSGRYTLQVRPGRGDPFVVASHTLGDAESKAREEAERKHQFLIVLHTLRESLEDLKAAAAAAGEGKRFADSRGEFLSDLWRQWLDEVFETDLRRLEDWHQRYRRRYAVDPRPGASADLLELLERTRALARFLSGEAHRRHGLQPPPGAASAVDQAAIDASLRSLAATLEIQDLSLGPEDRTDVVESDDATLTRKVRGEATILEIGGTVSLPDGCEYTAELRYHRPENRIIASRRGTGPEYWLRLDGMARSLPSGTYHMLIQVDYRAQVSAVRQRIDKEAPELRSGLRETITFVLGTEVEAAEEEEGRRSHYGEILGGIGRWFWEVQDRLEDAGQGEAFTLTDGGIDVAALRDWSEKLDSDMDGLRNSHEDFRGRTLALKYESAGRSTSQLLDMIEKEKEKGLAALLGRDLGGEAFEMVIGLSHLNALVKDDICKPIGLDPVTLGSLRLGEARRIRQTGDLERALDILRRTGRDRLREPILEALALSLAADIYLDQGREWRAFPILERLAGNRRYSRLGAGRKADKEVRRIHGESRPWTLEKQEAYRDDLAKTLEGIGDCIDGGLLEAAKHRLGEWSPLERSHSQVFRDRVTDEKILAEVDELFVTAKEEVSRGKECVTSLRQASKVIGSLGDDLRDGRLARYRKRLESEWVPTLEQMSPEGIPPAVIRRASGMAGRVKAEARRLKTAQESLVKREVQYMGVSGEGLALFLIPDSRIARAAGHRPGDQVSEGLYLLEIRALEGGDTVVLKFTDGKPFPLFLEDPE